ncbi:efflux transporter outer membrane subunit [Sphingosinicellaceae bacterium]|nr:efflux transporter outer membrane subunit [Sphingosinicellaceae bacterium]
MPLSPALSPLRFAGGRGSSKDGPLSSSLSPRRSREGRGLGRGALALLLTTALAACTVGPNYHRPPTVGTAPPANWKAAPGWQPAAPADDHPRTDWWAMFDDPVLSDLEARVPRANQDIAAAIAAYDQAQALVRENRAALFPTIGLSGGATRSGGGGGGGNIVSSGGTTSISTGGGARNRFSLGANASWVPDLFGQVRRGIEGARASAQASAADLANVTLASQGDLATNYIALRGLDAQLKLYDATTAAYQRALEITRNRYNAGVSARADLVQAEAQLKGAQANAVDLERQRAVYENAIAVLAGENPSRFQIAAVAWHPVVPAIPALLPSTLAERRPDVAAAERRTAAANAQVGVQTAAFFPTVSLTAQGSTSGSAVGQLFSAASNFWSFGASVAYTLLDFGARRARVDEAKAAYAQTVAQYRQTVLTAFGEVENNLSAADVLAREEVLRRDASVAADRAEAIALNQYKAGLIAFTDVITLQAQALNARLTLVASTRDRQATAVSLVQAIGGGWDATQPGAFSVPATAKSP